MPIVWKTSFEEPLLRQMQSGTLGNSALLVNAIVTLYDLSIKQGFPNPPGTPAGPVVAGNRAALQAALTAFFLTEAIQAQAGVIKLYAGIITGVITTVKTTSKEISSINEKILLYSDSAAKMNSEITKVSLTADIASELGSLQYISKVFNVSMDLVVNILIILFIIVFDPLAIAMVIAFNSMNLSKENSNNSIIELPKEEIPLSSVKYNVETIESTQEQPSEHPQITSETRNEPQILEEPLQTVQMEKEREDIYDEIQEKLKQKQERIRQSYTGGISTDTSKTY